MTIYLTMLPKLILAGCFAPLSSDFLDALLLLTFCSRNEIRLSWSTSKSSFNLSGDLTHGRLLKGLTSMPGTTTFGVVFWSYFLNLAVYFYSGELELLSLGTSFARFSSLKLKPVYFTFFTFFFPIFLLVDLVTSFWGVTVGEIDLLGDDEYSQLFFLLDMS